MSDQITPIAFLRSMWHTKGGVVTRMNNLIRSRTQSITCNNSLHRKIAHAVCAYYGVISNTSRVITQRTIYHDCQGDGSDCCSDKVD